MGNHSMTLSVTTDNDEQWIAVIKQFNRFLHDEGGMYNAVSISSINLDQPDSPEDPDGAHFDEYTLFKVYKALEAANVDTYQIKDCITQMQNAGILFRERSVE